MDDFSSTRRERSAESLLSDRQLPFSLIAEQSLLGSVLVNPEVLNEIGGEISSDDFYVKEHRGIYMAMHGLYLASRQIDVVTLIDELVSKGLYDKSGGEDYIRTLLQAVPNSLNAMDYARIIRQKSLLRSLIGVCDEVSEAAYSEQGDAKAVLELAESKVFDLSQGHDNKNFRRIQEVIRSVYADLHEAAERGGEGKGVPTGFSGLDYVLAGMEPGDLVLIGARPGMGKTSFALNVATNVAAKTKKAVCIFSLEMSAEQLVTRMISSEAMVDSHSLRTGQLEPKQWDDIAVAASNLCGCELLIDDTSGQSVSSMKGKLRRVKNLGLVVIDYLQLMQGERHQDNRVQEVADISRALKILAKELRVPVICCAQLSRGPESRTDKRPMLSDLRDSGAIEQDADCVLFLYRDEYYGNKENQEENNIAEVIVAKNRHGSLANVKMGWIGRFTKFRTLEKDENVPG